MKAARLEDDVETIGRAVSRTCHSHLVIGIFIKKARRRSRAEILTAG